MFDLEVKRLLRYLGIEIHTKYHCSPIVLSDIVDRFKIKLKFAEFDNSTCGMFVKSIKGSYIFINRDHHFHRQRFSMGHEFGHYILGHPSDVSTLLPGEKNREVEHQANEYSSCLLMPADMMLSLHQEKSSIIEMSKWLRVSAVAAAIRMKELGLRVDEAENVISDYWNNQGDGAFYINESTVTLT